MNDMTTETPALPPMASPAPVATPAPVPQPLSLALAAQADLVWAAVMVAAIAVVFLVLNLARGVAVPVLVSLALAYVLDPVVDWLEHHRVPRTLGVVLVFILIGAALLGFLSYLIPALHAEALRLPDVFGELARSLFPKLESRLGIALPHTWSDAMTRLSTTGAELAQQLAPKAGTWLEQALGGTKSLLTALIGSLVVPVISFFLLRDYDQIVAWTAEQLPPLYRHHVGTRMREIDLVMASFARGQLLVGAALATIYTIGLSFAGLNLAVGIGLVAGFGNMVPYVGSATGVLLALFSVFVSWQGPWQLLVIGATFLVGQALEATVLTPRIVGSKVGLKPVMVIIAVLAFAELFGFVGILLAVPTTAALKVIARVLLQCYRGSRWYQPNASA